MVHVIRTFDVKPDPATVLAYLKDFANANEWDPGTVSCTQVGNGPVEIGTHWNNTSKLIFITTELDYELVTLTDRQVTFKGTNKTATSIDDITVTPSGTGSRITYEATVTFNGLAKLTDPLMALIFRKLAADTVRDLSAALNKLSS